jgi:hypothetical protein
MTREEALTLIIEEINKNTANGTPVYIPSNALQKSRQLDKEAIIHSQDLKTPKTCDSCKNA